MRPIPSCPGYFADEAGNIWSEHSGRIRPIKGVPRQNGYLSFTALAPRRRSVSVHVVVCEAYHGPRPEGMTVAHLNGQKTDNRPENLAYATLVEQAEHKRKHGTMPCGDKCYMTKISDADMKLALSEVASGHPQARVARKYGMSPQTLWQTIHGRARKHLHQLQ